MDVAYSKSQHVLWQPKLRTSPELTIRARPNTNDYLTKVPSWNCWPGTQSKWLAYAPNLTITTTNAWTIVFITTCTDPRAEDFPEAHHPSTLIINILFSILQKFQPQNVSPVIILGTNVQQTRFYLSSTHLIQNIQFSKSIQALFQLSCYVQVQASTEESWSRCMQKAYSPEHQAYICLLSSHYTNQFIFSIVCGQWNMYLIWPSSTVLSKFSFYLPLKRIKNHPSTQLSCSLLSVLRRHHGTLCICNLCC